MGEPAIAVTGLRKSFGPKEAVAGIDLEIAAGSLAGLVGPNGAGKTTSLSMMTGLLRPGGGRVLINGLDMWADPPAAKAVIGVVPAEARLFERLSGEELLEYAGRLRGMPAGEARSRAAQLLGVLDLAEDAKRLVADYSTGMRKKAMLGCALIHNPSVLFLDEPLEGVDPVSADVIRRLLTRFVGSGSTVLFSSHVMELVEQVCDHVSIIDKGRIVATGTTDEVRGGKTLQRAFIDLVGSRANDEEVLSCRLRPRQHPGPRHAGPLPAPHPPARGRAAGRLGHGRLAGGHPDRPARGDDRAGPRRARPAHRAARGGAAGAVLHHAGPVRDHRPGRGAALAAWQGLRRPPVHPDLRGVRGFLPDRAEADLRGRADRFELRGRGPVAAVDTAGPGGARDL